MPFSLARAILLLSGLLLLPASAGAKPDPEEMPSIGVAAPAFSLRPFAPGAGMSEDTVTPVELDAYCGTRSPKTTAVLLFFVDEDGQADLAVANGWYRRFSKDGLQIIAVSEVKQPVSFATVVERARLAYPVLDDRHHVVSRRYGIDRAPFTLLLDKDCKVLGMGEKSLQVSSESLETTLEELLAAAKAAKKRLRR